MNTPTNLRSALLFLSMPVVWLGSFSLTGRLDSPTQLSPNFEFVPVAVHASHSADYSVDASAGKMAPVDPEIMNDAMDDQGITHPATLLLPADPLTNETETLEDPEDSNPDREPPTPSSSSNDADQGVVQEDPGQSGEDNGNKDKDEDSPGQSGEDHGNGGSGNNSNGGGKPEKPPKEEKPK